MKRGLKSLWRSTLLVVAALAAPLAADEVVVPTSPAVPLLWRVEGKSLTKPSYLFATLHASNPAMAKLHPSAEQAIGDVDVVATEIPLGLEDQAATTKHLMRADGSRLSASLGAELFGKLDRTLQEIHPLLKAEMFEPMKTWAVSGAIVLLPNQLQGNVAVDEVVWQQAINAGKQRVGIETMAEQVAAFEALSEEEQVIVLEYTLTSIAESTRLVDELMNQYSLGDAEGLTKTLAESFEAAEAEHAELNQKFVKHLLTDRDVRMAERMDQCLSANEAPSYFFAIGAAHLLGKQNVRDHLVAMGYRVTRVLN